MSEYVRNRLPPAEIPEGVTYYAITKHIIRTYAGDKPDVLVQLEPNALLDPEKWEGWFIPVQRTGTSFRVIVTEMEAPEFIAMMEDQRKRRAT